MKNKKKTPKAETPSEAEAVQVGPDAAVTEAPVESSEQDATQAAVSAMAGGAPQEGGGHLSPPNDGPLQDGPMAESALGPLAQGFGEAEYAAPGDPQATGHDATRQAVWAMQDTAPVFGMSPSPEQTQADPEPAKAAPEAVEYHEMSPTDAVSAIAGLERPG